MAPTVKNPSKKYKNGIEAAKPQKARASLDIRARLSVDVSLDLRRRIKVLAATKDTTVTNWVEAILRREVESAERRLAKTEAGPERWSALSNDAFSREWDSEGDAAYDRIA